MTMIRSLMNKYRGMKKCWAYSLNGTDYVGELDHVKLAHDEAKEKINPSPGECCFYWTAFRKPDGAIDEHTIKKYCFDAEFPFRKSQREGE